MDELTLLDPATFATFAAATPPARRAKELGENYLARAASGAGGAGGAGGKGKKDAAPAAAKKDAKGAAAAGAAAGGGLPVMIDNDNLPVVPLVENSALKLGSFLVQGSTGVVQPGQSVGVDVFFNPAGGAAVIKGKRDISWSAASF